MDTNRITGATELEMKYEKMYEKFLNGIITKKEWENFCTETLEELMFRNRQNLQSLKD